MTTACVIKISVDQSGTVEVNFSSGCAKIPAGKLFRRLDRALRVGLRKEQRRYGMEQSAAAYKEKFKAESEADAKEELETILPEKPTEKLPEETTKEEPPEDTARKEAIAKMEAEAAAKAAAKTKTAPVRSPTEQ